MIRCREIGAGGGSMQSTLESEIDGCIVFLKLVCVLR